MNTINYQNTINSMMDLTFFFYVFVDEERLSLILYIDDFEVCNPLGTSCKIHKVTAVYWVSGNISAQARSISARIYLAILC